MNQLNILFFVLVCGFLAMAAAETCPEEGFHVVQGDCSRYYRCVNGERFDFECPDDYKFHAGLEICVDAYELDCIALPRSSTETPPTTTEEPSTPTDDCPNGEGYFVDEEDCNRFYVCSDGVRYYSNCPSSFQFDTVSKSCVEAGTATCTN